MVKDGGVIKGVVGGSVLVVVVGSGGGGCLSIAF